MIAYIQISRIENKTANINRQFHHLYRASFYNQRKCILAKQYEPGDIIGAVLYPGYINEKQYKCIADKANEQHLLFYKQHLKTKKNIYCYPIIAIIPFDTPIEGRKNKTNIAALKINEVLLEKLKAKVGEKKLMALEYLCNQYDTTRNKNLEHRILILRTSHAINTLLGIKSAEFRTSRLGDKFVSKFKTKKDVERLLKYKKNVTLRNVNKLKTFVSNLKT